MRDEIWDAIKQHKKEKFDSDRRSFMEKAIADDDGEWVKHTDYHWSRFVAGKKLDYWPSRSKYQYDGKVMRGNVLAFIRKTESSAQ